MRRIKESKYDAPLEQKHHFIAKEFIRKINKKIYVCVSILDRFQNNQIFRTMPKTIHEFVARCFYLSPVCHCIHNRN